MSHHPYSDPLDAAFGDGEPSAAPASPAIRPISPASTRNSARRWRPWTAGAGAGGRRHRQDPRPDHAAGPHPGHPARLAGADPVRHLHQQGGARDEGAHRRADRRRGRRHAVAGHLPFHRRQDAAPACRAGGAENQFHHSGHRRPAAADEAVGRSRRHRRKTLAGAHPGGDDRRLEKSRACVPTMSRTATARATPSARARRSIASIRSG